MHIGPNTLAQGNAFYLTPTLFHFTTVLVISALGLVPGVEAQVAALIIAPWSVAAAIYSAAMAVLVRTRRLPDSLPPTGSGGHWSDVSCYGILPALLYLALIACAWSAWQESPNAPYALAIGLVALTILGIRNAWDLVTFIAPRSAATTE